MTESSSFQRIYADLSQSEEGRDFLAEFEKRSRTALSTKINEFIQGLGTEDLLLAGEQPSARGNDQVISLVRDVLHRIDMTREEVFSISKMAQERKLHGFENVGDELSAITYDTERATNQIMDCTDAITGHAKDTRKLVDKLTKALAEELGAERVEALGLNDQIKEGLTAIQDKSRDIVLACSFQDITSQRVAKVIEVIEIIDSQIAKIEMHLKGEVDVDEGGEDDLFIPPSDRDAQRNAGLLSGPALPNSGATQQDIDDLFSD